MKVDELKKNFYLGLIYQIITIACNLILPRFILVNYGSTVNGLINTIAQYLSVISFLELGVGSVIQSSLYEPLSTGDNTLLSKIYVSSNNFFNTIAKILIVYVIGLSVFFNLNPIDGFKFYDILLLLLSISLGSFIQYYFGIVNQIFLNADQKYYIIYKVQIFTILLNTIISLILIINRLPIYLVKLSTSLIYIIRPIYLSFYIRNHYQLDLNVDLDNYSIPQKWHGFSQHVTAIVLDSTDIIVLSLFGNLKDVSIYTVYFFVISGVKQIFTISTQGFQSFLGQAFVRNANSFTNVFFKCEWIVNNIAIFLMGCTSVLITPFVLLYTQGIHDANYNQELFGYLLTVSYACFCLRLPYHMMIRASGKYKETQFIYAYTAFFNIVLSILLVKLHGLLGVSLGTFFAMLLQLIHLAVFTYKSILKIKLITLCKSVFFSIFTIFCGFSVTRLFIYHPSSVLEFLILSAVIAVLWILVILFMNFLFYNNRTRLIFNKYFKFYKLKR